MKQYRKYLVSDSDKFDPHYFPFIYEEVDSINEATKSFSSRHKAGMIISFLKNVFMFTNWENENPELASLIADGSISSGNIAVLFESCRSAPLYSKELEAFLEKRFSEG